MESGIGEEDERGKDRKGTQGQVKPELIEMKVPGIDPRETKKKSKVRILKKM